MKARRYAEGTEVPIHKTRLELEELLAKYKAISTAFLNSPDKVQVAFEMQDRHVVFTLPLPSRDICKTQGRYDAACRQKWRALFISIKSKLVSVQEEIETFEEAFMAHVMMPDGQTVGTHVRPSIADAYKSKQMVPLLPRPSQ